MPLIETKQVHSPFAPLCFSLAPPLTSPSTAHSYPPPESLLGHDDDRPTFLIFYSSIEHGQMWCPHCRDVQGLVKAAFTGANKPNGIIAYIGNFAGWKNVPSHPARLRFQVRFVPTIIKLRNGKEVDRVEKSGILDTETFEAFLAN
ncbi:hypothetical protein IAU60_005011 [Kwoniella sp. DSM 27419]